MKTGAIIAAAGLLVAGVAGLALISGEVAAVPDARPSLRGEVATPVAVTPEEHDQALEAAAAIDRVERAARQPSAAERVARLEAARRERGAAHLERILADPGHREAREQASQRLQGFRARLAPEQWARFRTDLAELALELRIESDDPDGIRTFNRRARVADLTAELHLRAADYLTPEQLAALEAWPFRDLSPVADVSTWEMFDLLAAP